MKLLSIFILSLLFLSSSWALDHEEYLRNIQGDYKVTYKKKSWPFKKTKSLTFSIVDDILTVNTETNGACSGQFSFSEDKEAYNMDAVVISPLGKLNCEGSDDWIIARIIFPAGVTPNRVTTAIDGKIDIYLNGIYQKNNILFKKVKIEGPAF